MHTANVIILSKYHTTIVATSRYRPSVITFHWTFNNNSPTGHW